MKKPIKDYEGCYEISSEGYVHSLARVIQRKGLDRAGNPAPPITIHAKVLKNYKAKNGYHVVNLGGVNGLRQRYVHELVAEAFIGPRPHRATINHIDGNKLNNDADNLEYCSYAENNSHARDLGLNAVVIADHCISRPIVALDDNGYILMRYNSIKEAAEAVGLNRGTLWKALTGKRKKSAGMAWKYEEQTPRT